MKKNISSLIGLAVLVCLIVAAGFVISNMRGEHSAQSLTVQQKAVERAAVLCYALEGMYPPDIEYLEERYGLIVDRDKYIVHYETFGSNIRPDIAVFPRFGGTDYE